MTYRSHPALFPTPLDASTTEPGLSVNSKAEQCAVADVEGHIKQLTEKHATGNAFISSKASLSSYCWIKVAAYYQCPSLIRTATRTIVRRH